MARKRSPVKTSTFALAFSTLGPAWAARLEAPTNADYEPYKGGFFKRAAPCSTTSGIFASLLCLIGLSI